MAGYGSAQEVSSLVAYLLHASCARRDIYLQANRGRFCSDSSLSERARAAAVAPREDAARARTTAALPVLSHAQDSTESPIEAFETPGTGCSASAAGTVAVEPGRAATAPAVGIVGDSDFGSK